MSRSAVRPVLVAVVTLTLGLAPGAWAFQGWEGGPWDETGLSTSAPGTGGTLGLVQRAGRALRTFAAVGTGETPEAFSPWLGTGIQWKPAPGLRLTLEGRALVPAPSAGDGASDLTGGLAIHFTGW